MSDHTLRENAIEFIHYKRSLGYTYEAQEYLLERYVKFAESRTSLPVPLKSITDEFFSALTDAVGTLYQMVSVLREFSRYLQAHGFKETYMIPRKQYLSLLRRIRISSQRKKLRYSLKSSMPFDLIALSEEGRLSYLLCFGCSIAAVCDARRCVHFCVPMYMRKITISMSSSQKGQKAVGFS